MQPIDYFNKYDSEYQLDDDRTRIITSNRMKLLYSIVRTNKKMALIELRYLYSEVKTFMNSINTLLFLGVIKKIDDENIEYVEYKQGVDNIDKQ